MASVDQLLAPGRIRVASPQTRLSDILADALDALGVPSSDIVERRLAKLKKLLSLDVYEDLMEANATRTAIEDWARAASGEQAKATDTLAFAIAKKLNKPKLLKRIAKEVGEIKV